MQAASDVTAPLGGDTTSPGISQSSQSAVPGREDSTIKLAREMNVESKAKAMGSAPTDITDVDPTGRATPTASSSTVAGASSISARPNAYFPTQIITPPRAPTSSSFVNAPSGPSSSRPSVASSSLYNPGMPPARQGFGTLAGEDQLKLALASKDRLFLIMVSQEIEAFLNRIQAGETLREVQALGPTLSSYTHLSAFGDKPTVKLGSQSSSKFQRMLVYKAAEWYGAKAISGPEGVIFLAMSGDVPERSLRLKLAAIAPERPESIQQRFQIMQRSTPTGSPSRSSTDGSGPSRRKTLEEREAEYAAARERIYGSADTEDNPATASPMGVLPPNNRPEEDDIDPVSRYAYGVVPSAYDPTFPAVYYPSIAADNPYSNHASPGSQYPPYQPAGGVYMPAIPAMQYQTYQGPQPRHAGYPQMSNGYQPNYNGQIPLMGQPVFDANGNMMFLVQPSTGPYGDTWQSPQSNGIAPPQGAPGMQSPPAGWYPGMVDPSRNGMLAPPGSHVPAPLPGQVQSNSQPHYPSSHHQFQSHQNQSQYASPLVHPQPVRPRPQQNNSSASSSISSHSYQSYPQSRPHSRGSTTSTRSAASSVRLGAMYPAPPPALGMGFRQTKVSKGTSGAGLGGMYGNGVPGSTGSSAGSTGLNGLTSLNVGQERRDARGRSPSSNTTTSSGASRGAKSISLPPTSQHPLPQKPDWSEGKRAAQSGIPPSSPALSAVPPPSQGSTSGNSSRLSAPASSATQDEDESTVAANMVSNSMTGTDEASHDQRDEGESGSVMNVGTIRGRMDGILASAAPFTAGEVPAIASHTASSSLSQTFESRRTAFKPSPSLFDPSAAIKTNSAGATLGPAGRVPISGLASPQIGAPSPGSYSASAPAQSAESFVANGSVGNMSTEDLIEAKLQALSVSAGVSIGPPPARGSTYASAVRRD